MGNCIGKVVRSSKLPPTPSDGTSLTSDEMREIIKEKLRMKSSRINLGDRNYFAYNIDELKGFLAADFGDSIKYQHDSFDCDDFTYMMMGREKEWYGQRTSKQGSTFGIVWGDIRYKEEDKNENPHAVNFFIDKDLTLWLVEPQSDKIWKPTSNSTFWITMC